MAALDDVERSFEVDRDRLYVTGISMGGYGTWLLALLQPERFAAAVPVCGGLDRGVSTLTHALCEDALRLGRILAELMPDEAEVHSLVDLMELQASRLRARVDPNGDPVLLPDQDRSRWDYVLIHRGLAALARAERLGGTP